MRSTAISVSIVSLGVLAITMSIRMYGGSAPSAASLLQPPAAANERILAAATTASSPSTTRPCNMVKLMGTPGWDNRCTKGNRKTDVICENGQQITLEYKPTPTSVSLCLSDSEFRALGAAACAKSACGYPEVCTTVGVSSTQLNHAMCGALYLNGSAVCSTGEPVSFTSNDGCTSAENIRLRLQNFCYGKRKCRIGTSADYPNGMQKTCTGTASPINVSKDICPLIQTATVMNYSCSNGTQGTYNVPKDANGKMICLPYADLQKKATDLCSSCPTATTNVQENTQKACKCGVQTFGIDTAPTAICNQLQIKASKFSSGQYRCEDNSTGIAKAPAGKCLPPLQLKALADALCAGRCNTAAGGQGKCL
ncbi:MAG: hypothetical protein WCG83_03465 [Candidatus Peregrinibacteria bacterium]